MTIQIPPLEVTISVERDNKLLRSAIGLHAFYLWLSDDDAEQKEPEHYWLEAEREIISEWLRQTGPLLITH